MKGEDEKKMLHEARLESRVASLCVPKQSNENELFIREVIQSDKRREQRERAA